MTTNAPDISTAGFVSLAGDAPLGHRRVLRLFGLPLVIESNAERVMELAEQLFGEPTATEEPGADAPIATAPMRFRVLVESADGDAVPAPSPERWRFPDDDHALLSRPGVLGSIDLAAGRGVVYVDERVVRSGGSGYFAREVLEGPVLTLATRRDRHPVHAAALRCGDRALILNGPSGAGKSTVAYVASRHGIDVLCDDAIRVQRAPALRVWAGRRSRHIHLCEDLRERYAELRTQEVVELNGGIGKYAVSVPRPPASRGSPPPFVQRVRVCLLSPERGPVACEPASPDEIVEAILSAPEAGCDLYEVGRRPAAEAIAAQGGWRVRLSHDPEEALPLVRALLEQV